MSATPLVTIIVPMYNVQKYLQQSLTSIGNQTYKNLEILLINDGSTDNSGRIAEKFAEIDSRMHVYHKVNGGVSSARNLGIDLMQGEYVTFIDPDDSIAEDFIKILVDKIIDSQSDIVVCCANVYTDTFTKKNSLYLPLKDSEGYVDKEKCLLSIICPDYIKISDQFMDIGVTWGKLYSVKLIWENELTYNIQLRRNQDNIFNLWAFQSANKIYYIDKPLYFYRYEHMIKSYTNYLGGYKNINIQWIETMYSFIQINHYGKEKAFMDAYVSRLGMWLDAILFRYFFHIENTQKIAISVAEMDKTLSINSVKNHLKQITLPRGGKKRAFIVKNLINRRYFILLILNKIKLKICGPYDPTAIHANK